MNNSGDNFSDKSNPNHSYRGAPHHGRAPSVTFAQILERSRGESAGAAWDRATLASRLRRIAKRQRQPWAARALSKVKVRSVCRAMEILPAAIRIHIDDDYQIGLLSVRWDGHGWLHLPNTARALSAIRRKPGTSNAIEALVGLRGRRAGLC